MRDPVWRQCPDIRRVRRELLKLADDLPSTVPAWYPKGRMVADVRGHVMCALNIVRDWLGEPTGEGA